MSIIERLSEIIIVKEGVGYETDKYSKRYT